VSSGLAFELAINAAPVNHEFMLRVLFFGAIVFVAVVHFAPGLMDPALDTAPVVRAVGKFGNQPLPPAFNARLEAGAECPELIAVRNAYSRSAEETARMDAELGKVGCGASPRRNGR